MKRGVFSIKNGAMLLLLVSISAAFVTGCRKSEDTTGYPSNIPVAGFMAFNLTTDKTVDVSLSGNSVTASPLYNGNYTGTYLRIYTGNRTVESRDAATGNTLATTPYTFDSSRYYSAFVTGAGGVYKNVVVNDNFDSLSGTNGKAYVRYINAIPDSVNAATVALSAGGTMVSNQPAAYGSVSPFMAVAPGDFAIAVSGNGRAASRTITLEQQKVYTVLLSSAVGSANMADSLQIKYISNGTLDGTATNGGRTTTSPQQGIRLQ